MTDQAQRQIIGVEPHERNAMTLKEDVAKLADDESVMWAVGVLSSKGINGVLYEKLLAMTCPTCNRHNSDPLSINCSNAWHLTGADRTPEPKPWKPPAFGYRGT